MFRFYLISKQWIKKCECKVEKGSSTPMKIKIKKEQIKVDPVNTFLEKAEPCKIYY